MNPNEILIFAFFLLFVVFIEFHFTFNFALVFKTLSYEFSIKRGGIGMEMVSSIKIPVNGVNSRVGSVH